MAEREHTVKRGDVVKLGKTAQELHTVLYVAAGRVRVRQHTTGKERSVDPGRVVVVAPQPDDVGGER